MTCSNRWAVTYPVVHVAAVVYHVFAVTAAPTHHVPEWYTLQLLLLYPFNLQRAMSHLPPIDNQEIWAVLCQSVLVAAAVFHVFAVNVNMNLVRMSFIMTTIMAPESSSPEVPSKNYDPPPPYIFNMGSGCSSCCDSDPPAGDGVYVADNNPGYNPGYPQDTVIIEDQPGNYGR
ncbi:unnamed protein product [Pieris macdunnoughi]|uniref:Uncharacterized protein n=1 Tax=Pieris macdunnoughi TaxID=345717 RepID=A0A821QZ05_9NEOP|nr:unnamed protein product [Pieris macdunnoughi]